MSAAETAKELVRIATTHGLAKDVIDLLDKKASLLAEQVSTLEQENTTLLRENRKFKLENEILQRELQIVEAKRDKLAQTTQDILVYFFKQGREISEREIAQNFKIEFSMAVYHLDLLCNRRLIDRNGVFYGNSIGFGSMDDDIGGDVSARYEISAEGRKYIVENGLAT